MKRLAWLIIIVTLPVITFFQYKKYNKFNPPSIYQYPVNDSVDIHYYDPLIVEKYFENVYRIESLARELWYSKGLDVKFPDLDIEGSEAELKFYRQLWATTRVLEEKLLYATRLKAAGFNNQEIRRIVEEGIAPELVRYADKQQLLGLKMGDQGQGVWEVQDFLLKKSYQIPFDGVFGLETQQSLIDFQKKHNLIPSGIVNNKTLQVLIE